MSSTEVRSYQFGLTIYLNCSVADAAYNAIKKVSKAKLEISKEKLAEAEDDIRDMFESMENVRSSNCFCDQVLTVLLQKLDPASLEDLQRELENLQAQLELQVANNPGVIEQYERRKQEVRPLDSQVEQVI
jgi:structural maintenance of chromosomes protein 5